MRDIGTSAILRIALGGVLALLPVTGSRANPVEDMLTCSRVGAPEARLACYDALAEQVARQPEASVTPSPEHPDAEAVFGSEKIRKTDQEQDSAAELDSLSAKIVKVVYSPRDYFVVKLENGQIWKQLSGRKVPFLKEGTRVTIKKGALGSYNMAISGKSSFVRVSRVK